MTVETATQWSQLDPALPSINDLKREAPQHFALLKNLGKNYFSSLGATYLTVSSIELNYSAGLTGLIQGQLDALDLAKANKSGAVYTGTHDFTGGILRAATLPPSDSSDKVATMAALTAAMLAGTLPGIAGNGGKGVRTDGASVFWAFGGLTPTPISSNTVATPGNYYIFTTAGLTLTIPNTFAAGDPVGFGMSRGVAAGSVDWGLNKLKGRTPGVMALNGQNNSAICQMTNATDGFMESN